MMDKIKKKVKPFPIHVDFQPVEAGGVPFKGEILKLAPQGFLAEIPIPTVRAGEKLTVSFEIPVQHHTVVEPVVIMKVYHQPPVHVTKPEPMGTDRRWMIEVHFILLEQKNEASISSFLHSIPGYKP